MSLKPHRHLTHRQLCDVLLADSQETSPRREQMREHLRDCPLCAAELASLRQPLSLFRSATTAWASHTSASCSRTLPALPDSLQSPLRDGISGRRLSRPVVWASAAALLFAAAIPLTLHEHRTSYAPTQETVVPGGHPCSRQIDRVGDEALLEEIDQTLSSPVPTPMQPLADPTAGRSNQIDSTPRKN